MKERTILQSILQVMEEHKEPMTPHEISHAILEKQLYKFNTDNPIKVVEWTLRNHTQGVIRKRSSKNKYFIQYPNGKYWFLKREQTDSFSESPVPKDLSKEEIVKESLKNIHEEYVNSFRGRVLNQLKLLSPYDFEIFSKRLLENFGFRNVSVTNKSGDGGIDGYGNLEMGMGHLKFGFQCKRYDKSSISPVHLREFRGSLNEQGLSQGIFFTTSKFSESAQKAALISGAIPIMIFDGFQIVDLMVEKRFGINVYETLPVYEYSLELDILEEESLY